MIILSESPERYIWASTFISDYNSTKNLVKAGRHKNIFFNMFYKLINIPLNKLYCRHLQNKIANPKNILKTSDYKYANYKFVY